MALGMLLTACAFLAAAYVELKIKSANTKIHVTAQIPQYILLVGG